MTSESDTLIKKTGRFISGLWEVPMFIGYTIWLRIQGKEQDWETGEIRDINPKEDDDKNV